MHIDLTYSKHSSNTALGNRTETQQSRRSDTVAGSWQTCARPSGPDLCMWHDSRMTHWQNRLSVHTHLKCMPFQSDCGCTCLRFYSPELAVGFDGEAKFVTLALGDIAPLRRWVAPTALPLCLVSPRIAETKQLHWSWTRVHLRGKGEGTSSLE